MRAFEYVRAASVEEAVRAKAADPHAKFLGGGTNLIDLMKYDVEQPARLIDVTRLPLTKVEPLSDGGLRIGALARNSDLAAHPLVVQRYAVLAQALLAGASPQLRNMATTGGNLLQRTRCYYFYDPAFPACNKRKPGSGCGAIDGFNRMHAILGQSDQCIAVHPSDMCVALAALDAVIRVRGSKGERAIPIAEFHRLPGNTPDQDTNLGADELITAVDLPVLPASGHYLKVRDRASYAFALVSVAAMLQRDNDGAVKLARIALGGVAHKPWRATTAEAELVGKRVDAATLRSAAETALAGAHGYKFNDFKIELARRSIVRALQIASQA